MFSIFFGPQFSLIVGMCVGYLWVFKFLTCLDSGPQTIKAWEERWPFKSYKENPCFFATQSSLANDPAANRAGSGSTGAAANGGASSGGSMFSSFMGGGNSSQTATVGGAGSGSGGAKKEESKSSFKAFGGKGKSLGSDLSNSRGPASTSIFAGSTSTT